MGRSVVEIEVVLLHILAMIAFAVGKAEEAFLQDRVAPIPERQGEAQPLLVVANSGESILAPAVGAGPCLVVREVVPGIPVAAVVFANRAPLPFAQVRTPLLPGNSRRDGFLQPLRFPIVSH